MSALLGGKRLTTGKYKTFQELCPSIEIEGFNEIGVDVQYPWEDAPRRYHLHRVHVNSFWMDK